MSETDPPDGPRVTWAKKRLPFEVTPSPFQPANRIKFLLFAVLTISLAALAGYMYLVWRFPLTDGRVVAPAIGALWFALRIFMMLTPRVPK
ncbi:MAG: hypothetical protein ABUL73_05210 [Alphaproteobacteria bacterium]